MNIIIHYHEIALKGKNRPWFERKLVENIQRVLDDLVVDARAERMSGRLHLAMRNTHDSDTVRQLRERLRLLPGIAFIGFAREAEQSIEAIRQVAWKVLRDEEFKTFRVTTKRSNKQFPSTSHDMDVQLGSLLVEQLEEARGEHPHKIIDEDGKTHWGWVDLEHPDIAVFVEIVEDRAFVYTDRDRFEGPGGLPVSTAGTLISLLSSGIDSPVAAYRMMVRGARCVFVHMHSYPYTSRESQEDVLEIVRTLSDVQGASTVYLVPFADVQQQLVDAGNPDFRLLLYRRLFLRVAEVVAHREEALGVVTGESLGQVASQTLQNMQAVESVATLPLYRPLVGQNKEDITEQAQALGTYETAIRSGDDCCSLFLPDHPATKATAEDIDAIERTLPIEEWVDTLIEKAEKRTITGRG